MKKHLKSIIIGIVVVFGIASLAAAPIYHKITKGDTMYLVDEFTGEITKATFGYNVFADLESAAVASDEFVEFPVEETE